MYGNVVTLDLGQAISRRSYFAQVLLRHYALPGLPDHVLGIDICLCDPGSAALEEPVMVVADTTYATGSLTAAESVKRYWDPWYAWLGWLPKGEYNRPFLLQKPSKRPTIDRMAVATAPLASILSVEAAMPLIVLVEQPNLPPR